MADRFAMIDNSLLLMYLFYPRRQHRSPSDGAFDLAVPVESDLSIVCRAYPGESEKPWILYFHGNGEIVSDYDSIAHIYTDRGINLLVADYRGYGASGGNPTFKAMVEDAVKIFDYLYMHEQFNAGSEKSSWYVMGRSLGSISALELASKYPEKLEGLIIESGFLSVVDLIRHLGLPSPGNLEPLESEYRTLAGLIKLPALLIHGDRDRLVPLEQGKALHDALGSEDRELVVIPGADHNDVMFVDTNRYMGAIEKFVLKQ